MDLHTVLHSRVSDLKFMGPQIIHTGQWNTLLNYFSSGPYKSNFSAEMRKRGRTLLNPKSVSAIAIKTSYKVKLIDKALLFLIKKYYKLPFKAVLVSLFNVYLQHEIIRISKHYVF